KNVDFAPCSEAKTAVVEMAIDEYECIRLIDYLSLTQEECAAQMNVARTTVQAIYDSARKKISDVLINGKRLVIGGGCYNLCENAERCCGKDCKCICRISRNIKAQLLTYVRYRRIISVYYEYIWRQIMKIAVTYEDGQVFGHFGHCENFKIYDIENSTVKSSQVVSAIGSGHGALA
ncbi:MAG: DUF134 domain-containing protein, partial [Oscillospiraceae bacterium]